MKKLLALVVVFCTGCSTVVNGRHQEVGISSTPSGAECRVGDQTIKTPSVVKLKRNNSYTVECQLAGYQTASSAISHGATGWLFGNLVFGMLPGLIVDFATGSAYKLKPDTIQVTMQK